MAKVVLHRNEGLKLHTTLAQLLGFKEHHWMYNVSEVSGGPTEERIRIKADFITDVRTLHYNLYIYSSIVQPHLCRTEYLPLLRTVNVEGTEGSYISRVYEIPHYLSLSSNFIESIDIKIADNLGQNMQFQYGKVIIKLHFRRRSFLHQITPTMPRVQYICNPRAYQEHYGRGLPTFQGDVIQDGYGLGNIIGGLFRSLIPLATKHIMPVLKRTAGAAGKSLLRSGANVAKDVILELKGLKSSVKCHGQTSLQDLVSHIGKELNTSQKGGGYRRPCKKKRRLQRKA